MSEIAGIYIPTKNRQFFVRRQLNFYKKFNSKHSVYIGDSSNLIDFNELSTFIKENNFPFKVFHFHIPDVSAEDAHMFLVERINEKYCAFCGDDDFLIPMTIGKAVDILSKNQDIRISQGKSLILTIKDNNLYGNIDSLSDYINNTMCDNESYIDRLIWFSENYFTLQFSVHRTSEYLQDMINVEKIKDRAFTELLTGFACMLKGKSYLIDDLYLIRQDHDNRNIMYTLIDWITSKDWYPSYLIFRETLVSNVMNLDSTISNKDAEKMIQNVFFRYLSRSIVKKRSNLVGKKRFILKELIYKLININPRFKNLIKNTIWKIKYRSYSEYYNQTLNFLKNEIQ